MPHRKPRQESGKEMMVRHRRVVQVHIQQQPQGRQMIRSRTPSGSASPGALSCEVIASLLQTTCCLEDFACL